MSPTMRIDDDIWEYLKKHSSFVDTPSTILRRQLKDFPMPQSTTSSPRMPLPNGTRHVLQADRDYANVPITSYELRGKTRIVHTYKEVLLGICETLRREHTDQFDNVALALHGKKRSYFAHSDAGMKHPKRVSGLGATSLFVESNLSATSIMGLSQYLVRRFAPQDADSFGVH
jgi:negative regulator of replication initiation